MNKPMPRNNQSVSLSDLPTHTGGVPEWMQRMRDAAQQVVTEEVMEAIVQKQIDLAKEGNPAEIKFVFEQLLGGSAF